jgi:hypothetical protein
MAKLAQERIDDLVKRHRPRGWRVAQSKHRWKWDSAACCNVKRILYVPTLKCDESLFLYFHEVGHVIKKHFDRKPAHHIEEFEAELYAVHIFRSEGIPVTKYIRDGIRERLCSWIVSDAKKGIPIQRHIARWANHKVKTRGRNAGR